MSEDFVPAAGRTAFTGAYDSVIAVSTREAKLRGGAVKAIAETCAGREAPRVLELGCGTGSLSLAIAKGVPGVQVTGLDLDPQALGIARSKRGAQLVDWVLGSATDPPPVPGSWDCVVISLVLHHLKPAQQPVALERA